MKLVRSATLIMEMEVVRELVQLVFGIMDLENVLIQIYSVLMGS